MDAQRAIREAGPVVKWEEDGQQRESVCYNQAVAELFATRLLQQADIEEVFLVLPIKKGK